MAKTLVISDLHLTKRFDPKKFNKILNLLSNADKVIINGDFWDSDFLNFDQFVNSKWTKLFPLLKSKDTVYLYGNHDEEYLSDERVNLFSNNQSYWFRFNLKKGSVVKLFKDLEVSEEYSVLSPLILVFNHGQDVVRYQNMVHKIIGVKFFKPLKFVIRFILDLRIKFLGKRHYELYRPMNNKIKQWITKNLESNEILVCGHSHLQEFDLEARFIDLGHNSKGHQQYMVIESPT